MVVWAICYAVDGLQSQMLSVEHMFDSMGSSHPCATTVVQQQCYKLSVRGGQNPHHLWHMLLLCTCGASEEPLEVLGGQRGRPLHQIKTPDFTSKCALNRPLWVLACFRPAFYCYSGGRDWGTILRQVCCPLICCLFSFCGPLVYWNSTSALSRRHACTRELHAIDACWPTT
jgi:hypothetical protein